MWLLFGSAMFFGKVLSYTTQKRTTQEGLGALKHKRMARPANNLGASYPGLRRGSQDNHIQKVMVFLGLRV